MRRGANIVLLQELFAGPYFCIEQRDCFEYAIDLDEDKGYIHRFQLLARELNVVLPLSFYERSNNAHFNSMVMIDSDGSQLGIYRKSHIPDGPGYQEKYYFSPGNTGFKVFQTQFGKVGVGICWDQWFPEAARVMGIDGAEILLYPTAIGSEPHAPALDSGGHWQRCMQGHSAANMIPVVASNRIGREVARDSDVAITFYGSSFMTDHTGKIVADAGRHQETILVNTYNFTEIKRARMQWGVFRDRRPELYGKLNTFDGIDANSERHAPLLLPPQNDQVYRAISTGAPVAATVSVPLAISSGIPSGLATPIANSGPIVPKNKTLMNTSIMQQIEGEPNARSNGNPDVQHEATFIGSISTTTQRRPRGRCWVCRNKTTYECKECLPGPVPLCNRTARNCWNQYHSGVVGTYAPNRRGRKRKKSPDPQEHVEQQVVEQITVPQGLPQMTGQHVQQHHENDAVVQSNTLQAPELNASEVDAVNVTAQAVNGVLAADNGVGELLQ